mgnify:CR=1 FL=1
MSSVRYETVLSTIDGNGVRVVIVESADRFARELMVQELGVALLKVRGVRIEPREIEQALASVPEVAQSAATWFETGSGTRGLIAAVVWHKGRSLQFETLQGLLQRSLPQAMVPSRFVALDRLPEQAFFA